MKYNKCLLVLSALAAVAFTGCKNEDVEKHRFDNKFYITSTILSDDLLIKSDTPGYTKTIESRLAKPAAQQVAVTIGADPSQVAAYNMIYGDNAVALPAECYELSSNRIDIAAGQVSGDAIEIVFKDINTLDGSGRASPWGRTSTNLGGHSWTACLIPMSSLEAFNACRDPASSSDAPAVRACRGRLRRALTR